MNAYIAPGAGKLAAFQAQAARRQATIRRQVEDALLRCGASKAEVEALRKEREVKS